MIRDRVLILVLAVLLVSLFSPLVSNVSAEDQGEEFSFIVTADMREYTTGKYQNSNYFQGTCEAIMKVGRGAFMISPGDIDPPEDVYQIIQNVLGEDYTWYPAVGNHEAETPSDMEWLRSFLGKGVPNQVRSGPINCEETMYSFDYGNTHFVVLNVYYAGFSDSETDGNISPEIYRWLEKDLKENKKPNIFVFGHEPIVSIPDADSGRIRHVGDNLDAHPEFSFKFQELLIKHNVMAYFCGHTHNFSYSQINGLWQIDAGHCRGIGDDGAPSTFLKFYVNGSKVRFEAYRTDKDDPTYSLKHSVTIQ